MKKILFMFLCLNPGFLSASVFSEAFDMSAPEFSRQANRVAYFFKENVAFDNTQQEKELNYLTKSLLKNQDDQKNNPVYWFVRGMHARNLASYEQHQGNKVLAEENIASKNKYYKTAMELDKTYQPHLSAAAYAVMKPGLPDELKQYAIESELDLGGNGENDSYYWYLHWSNINALSQQKRFDEAESALDRMREELAAEGLDKSAYTSLLNKAEKEYKNYKSLDRVDKGLSNKKPVESDVSKFIAEYLYFIIWFLVVLIIIVIASVLFMYSKNRRSS